MTDIVQEINAEIRRVTGDWPESQFCVDLASRAMAEITRLRAALRDIETCDIYGPVGIAVMKSKARAARGGSDDK